MFKNQFLEKHDVRPEELPQFHLVKSLRFADQKTASSPWALADGLAVESFSFACSVQWIGLRENLQETMVFTIKYRGFLWIFPSSSSMIGAWIIWIIEILWVQPVQTHHGYMDQQNQRVLEDGEGAQDVEQGLVQGPQRIWSISSNITNNDRKYDMIWYDVIWYDMI